LAIVNGNSIRDLLISYLLQGTIITEVFLENSNQPAGTPDLAGVVVREVGGNYVIFSQAGSAGSTRLVVVLDKILVIEV
jgi:hypothetical protein